MWGRDVGWALPTSATTMVGVAHPTITKSIPGASPQRYPAQTEECN